MSARILLVDDDRFLLENIARLIQSEGYDVRTASDGAEALRTVEEFHPELAVLDVGLPDTDGMTLCRTLRKGWRFPIIMLTALSESGEKIQGLEAGADDYLTKPFDPGELVARVKAQLRRAQEYATPGGQMIIGGLVIDQAGRTVTVDGRSLELTNKEFALLAHLAENVGKVVSREELFSHSWGFDISFGSNSLDVYIYRLRRKLEPQPDRPRYLHTIKGYGYKLEDQG
jgi:two-component system response regulator PrrA